MSSQPDKPDMRDDYETIRPTEDAKRRQKNRSRAIALALIALAILFFVVTIVRLGGNMMNRPV